MENLNIPETLKKGGHIAIDNQGAIKFVQLEKKDINTVAREYLEKNLGETLIICNAQVVMNSEISILEKTLGEIN